MTGSAIETLNRTADVWWTYVFHATWQSSLVAAVLLTLVWMGRRWPARLRYGIILIALVKFCIPPTLALPTGLFTHLGPAIVLTEESSDIQTFSALTANQQAEGLTWQGGLLLVHLLGAAAVACWIIIQLFRLSILSRRCERVTSGPLHNAFTRLLRRMGVRRQIRLLVSGEPLVPMAFGVLRPRVIIPDSLCRDLSWQEVETVLAHELAHHRHGDIWLNWMKKRPR